MCCQHCCGLPCQQFPFCHFRLRKRLLWLWRCWLLPKHCFWQAYFSRVKRWPSATEAGSAPGVCGKGWLEKLEHLKAKNKGALAKTSEVCERVGQGNGATPRTYPGGTISTSARPNQQERLSAIQRLAESINGSGTSCNGRIAAGTGLLTLTPCPKTARAAPAWVPCTAPTFQTSGTGSRPGSGRRHRAPPWAKRQGPETVATGLKGVWQF